MNYPRYLSVQQKSYYDKFMDKCCNKWCPKCKEKQSLVRHKKPWVVECNKCQSLFKAQRPDYLKIGAKDPKLEDSNNWKATCGECGGIMDYYNFRYGCRKCGNILEV